MGACRRFAEHAIAGFPYLPRPGATPSALQAFQNTVIPLARQFVDRIIRYTFLAAGSYRVRSKGTAFGYSGRVHRVPHTRHTRAPLTGIPAVPVPARAWSGNPAATEPPTRHSRAPSPSFPRKRESTGSSGPRAMADSEVRSASTWIWHQIRTRTSKHERTTRGSWTRDPIQVAYARWPYEVIKKGHLADGKTPAIH